MRRTPMHRAAAETAGGAAGDPAQPGTSCTSYAPGHLMHYTHRRRALRSPAVAAAGIRVRGAEVAIALPGGEVLHWRHHDPERLTRLLHLVLGPRMVYLDEHALRVGPYWFNCAEERDWVDCR
ncbi:MAG: hypothetical protein ACXVFU_16070 [Nocardioidaceae bacterium]